VIVRCSSHQLHCAVTSAKREAVTLRAAMHAPTMSRWLLILANTALGIASLVFALGILDAVRHIPPVPAPREGQLASAPPVSVSPVPKGEGAAAYPEITLGNLFDPHRMEAASRAVEPTAPWTGLVLQGVVVEGGRGRAFLEEPVTKRVAAFSAGDAVPGGVIEKISDDRVIIAGPGGRREVLLRDPSKPRPVLAAAVTTPATAPATAPAPPPTPERIAAPPVTQTSGGAPLLGRRIRGLNE
jgi:hypothetical protein